MRPQDRLPPPMRFFEYESRKIVAKAGIPTSPHGFATSPEEARRIAQDIGAPTVIKSQVLTGGRMKAGGVKFADTPDEAASHAEEILAARDQRPRTARCAGGLARRRQAGVLRRRHVGRDAQAAGDDLLADGRDRHRGGGRDPSGQGRPQAPLQPARARGLRGQGGHRLHRRHRQGAPAPDADHGPAGPAVLRVRHDAGGDQPARRARGRHVRRRRRPHGHGERGPAAPEGAAEGARRRRRGDPPGPRGDASSSSPARPSTPRTTAASPAT